MRKKGKINITSSHDGINESQGAELVKENLLALGIDLDPQLIQRLQKLGLDSTLRSTSRAADSIRSRNPYGVSSAIIYQNIEDPMEYIFQEKREVEQEWIQIDKQRIFQILSDFHQHSDKKKNNSVIDLIRTLRMHFIRSPERFIDRLLSSNRAKGRLRTNDIMRSRYISRIRFNEIIHKIHTEGALQDIEYLFNKLSQRIELGGNEKVVVDLKAFLFLLEIATGDSRRAYEDKTSLAATEVEFWTKFDRQYPVDTPNTKRNIISSKGFIYEESYSPHTPRTLASLLRDTNKDP